MLYKLLGLFLSDKVLSKLGWVAKLGGLVKVHAAPLLGGTCFGVGGFTLQEMGVVKVDFSLLVNQTLLDSLCTAYQVCGLTVSMGGMVVSSLIFGVVVAYALERFYVAESPNSKLLVAINANAQEVINKVGEVTGTPIETLKDQ